MEGFRSHPKCEAVVTLKSPKRRFDLPPPRRERRCAGFCPVAGAPLHEAHRCMPVLKNARHEKFCQGVATGKTADEAYVLAGYQENRANAARLKANEHIRKRIEEIEAAVTERVIEKTGITKERVLAELGKIGFSDIRKAVDWQGLLVTEEDNPDGGDTLVVKHIHNTHVRLISAKDLDDDTAAAIAEVRQSPTGGLSLKLHDKRAALVDIGKHLGMFTEKVEHTGKDGGPIQTEELSPTERGRRIAFALAQAGRAPAKEST